MLLVLSMVISRSGTALSSAASSWYVRRSRSSRTTSSGKTTTTSQAPSVNFVTAKMRTTAPATAPTAVLTMTLARHRPSRCVVKYRAMPNPASVKPVKTPIA